jgi:hypothetical protein
MNYAELSKKDYIHTDSAWIRAGNRQGVFQNWDENAWEYWEHGQKVAAIPFAEVPSEGALQNWLENIDEVV